jgi:DNA-binding IclR family transcriptional regulator
MPLSHAIKDAKNMEDTEQRTVAAVERAMRLLEAFRSSTGVLSLTELAERTNLYKSTVLRLAATLEQFGFIVRRVDGAFQLGPTPFYLGAVFQRTIQPPEIILPVLRELVETFGESASFFVEQKQGRVCLYRVNSPQLVRAHLSPGDIVPLDRGAGGKILLAFREPDNPAYRKIRKTLVLSSSGEIGEDMTAVASVVFDSFGGVSGALVITGPQRRFNRNMIRRAERHLLLAAQRVTQALGGDLTRFAEAIALLPPE